MASREQIVSELNALNQSELEQVAKYVAFVRYQSLVKAIPVVDQDELATLYMEFSDEDRKLAEHGMSDYAAALANEEPVNILGVKN